MASKPIKCPSWLAPAARDKWASLSKQIPKLADKDADALALLCGSWATYWEAGKRIEEHGQVLAGDGGRLFVNPACNVANEAWKQIVKLSNAFGLMPEPVAKGEEELEFE